MATPTEQAYSELQHATMSSIPGSLPGSCHRVSSPCSVRIAPRGISLASAGTTRPSHFTTRSTEEVLSTLAHEMAYLWQHHCGTPSRSAYHNKAWAAKMDASGLCLSHTRAPGGKRTGQHMSHDIVAGGPFAQACTDLLAAGFVISWRDRVRAHAPGKGKTGGESRCAHQIHLPKLWAQRLGEGRRGVALWRVCGGAGTGGRLRDSKRQTLTRR
jgi:hypothetical protein